MRQYDVAGGARVTLRLLWAVSAVWLWVHPGYAQISDTPLEDGEAFPEAAGQIILQGSGYQLVESDPSLTDGDSVSDETGAPVEMPAGARRVWVFDGWQGVQNAPIPEELKADMAEEFNTQAFTASDGLMAEDDEGMWMIDEAAAAEALAAVEEPVPGGGGGKDGPRPLPQGFCSKKRKTGTQSKTIPISPSIVEREIDGGKIRANLNQSGQVTATVVYTKKSRCGITYGVKVERVDLSGTLDLPGSEIGYTGVLKSELNAPLKLFEFATFYSFYVGPIRVVISPSVRADANIRLSSEVQVSAGLRAGFNGRYSFDYTCTKSGCVEKRPFESFFETTPDGGQLIGSVSARVVLEPSVNVAARVVGYLYIKSLQFFTGELGVNLAVPAELWLYAGNTCGDANGDGQNETVRGAIFDISSEVFAYADFKFFGFRNVKSLVLGLPIPWVKKLVPDSIGARKTNTYRRNFFYRDLEPGGSTALSPMLVNASTLPQTQSMITLRARPCVPFFGPSVDYVVDFGTEGPQTFSGSPSGTTIRHDWKNVGSQGLNAYIARDAFMRDINSPVTSRTVYIEPTPCTFNGARVASGASVTAFQTSSVPFGGACVSEQRVCTNGTLSGSFAAASCAPAPPANCSFNGSTVAHGSSVTAYWQAASLPCEACESQRRTCYNGVLSGGYTHSSCIQRRRPPGHQCE